VGATTQLAKMQSLAVSFRTTSVTSPSSSESADISRTRGRSAQPRIWRLQGQGDLARGDAGANRGPVLPVIINASRGVSAGDARVDLQFNHAILRLPFRGSAGSRARGRLPACEARQAAVLHPTNPVTASAACQDRCRKLRLVDRSGRRGIVELPAMAAADNGIARTRR